MTVGLAIKCEKGLVVASDSKATFGRGVPIAKFIAKIHKIEHPDLEFPVMVVGAGSTAFVDKFLDRTRRDTIKAAREIIKRKLDIIDFAERVCEPLVTALYKEYYIDRAEFVGVPSHYSLGLIVAGATRDGEELRAFFVHYDGLTENIPDYGTIGSGAAYAELFLRELVSGGGNPGTRDASSLAVYAIKGAEIMDPNVGGKACVHVLSLVEDKSVNEKDKPTKKKILKIETAMGASKFDKRAKTRIYKILSEMGKKMRTLIEGEKR